MDEATFTAGGVDYVGIELVLSVWWICYRCDDPDRILRFVKIDEAEASRIIRE